MSKKKSSTTPWKPLEIQIIEMINQSGLTLNAVAVGAGVPHPVLYRFMSGVRVNIRLDTADKLCRFFDVGLTAPRKRKAATKATKGK